jgi:DNA replication licensing factor MCM2
MYARERVRPKLYDMDSEKLSRLFADLRRESVATGSFPITVRHLESMIRMAEASAKMSLREYVRADDIDLAISVAVESFVNAQKMSIKKTLQRVRAPLSSPAWGVANWVFFVNTTQQGFRKYLTQSRDHEELLSFLLGQIVKEKARFFQLQRHQQPELVTVKISELDERVRDPVVCRYAAGRAGC